MKKKIFVSVLVIIILLLFPLIVKDRSSPLAHFTGPELGELDYTEVNFTNIHDATKLAGMLFLPKGEGPFPTVIIIHGRAIATGKMYGAWRLWPIFKKAVLLCCFRIKEGVNNLKATG